MFTRNEGGLDRAFRIILGLLLILAGFVAGGAPQTPAHLAKFTVFVGGAVALLTGAIGT